MRYVGLGHDPLSKSRMIKEPLNGFRTLESMPLNTQPIAAGEAVIGEAFAHRVLYANWQIRRSPRCPHRSPA